MKKSQITFFIIIGIFIILAFGVFFYFSKSTAVQMDEKKDLDSNKHKEEITNFIEECMQVTLDEGIADVGIKDMDVLEKYIDEHIGTCIDGFDYFKNTISTDLKVDETYRSSNIDKFKRYDKEGNLEIAGRVTLDYETVFHYNDYEVRLDSFEIIAPLLKDDLDIRLVTFIPIHRDPTNFELLYDLDVSTGGGLIVYEQDATSEWPASDPTHEGMELVGNPFIIFKGEDGKWYGTSHEWMGKDRKAKNICSINGRSPIIDGVYLPEDWVPQVGETYYFMITGLSRLGASGVSERTKLKKFVWKEDVSRCIGFEG